MVDFIVGLWQKLSDLELLEDNSYRGINMPWYIYNERGYRERGPFGSRTEAISQLKHVQMYSTSHTLSWSVAYEGDDTSNNSRSYSSGGGSGSSLLGFIIIFVLMYACYDATIGKRIDISDVEKYCSADQLTKTGQAKCTEVKWKLSNRYNSELVRDKDKLKNLINETPKLLQNKQEKCSQAGLKEYGTEGCSSATRNLEQNKKSINNLVQTISQKHQRITEMQLLQLYKVNATSLNVRDCMKTSCRVVIQLKSGAEVYVAKDDDDEWVRVEVKGGTGYVMKKYLTPIQNSVIKVDFSDKKEEDVQVTDVEEKSNNIINSSASTQPKTTDFREVNWPSASYQDVINMISVGANINQTYEDGTSVLMLAVDMGANPQAIQALIDKGANVNAKNDNEDTVLSIAAYQNSPQVIEVLAKNGANINSTGFSGITPLMLAAKDNKNPNIIEALIKAGANVNQKSGSDMTALDYAAYGNQNPKILETLIKHGATIDENTLNWARENENIDVLIFLKKYLENNNKTNSKKLFGIPLI